MLVIEITYQVRVLNFDIRIHALPILLFIQANIATDISSLHEGLQCTSIYTACLLGVSKQFSSLGNELSVQVNNIN